MSSLIPVITATHTQHFKDYLTPRGFNGELYDLAFSVGYLQKIDGTEAKKRLGGGALYRLTVDRAPAAYLLVTDGQQTAMVMAFYDDGSYLKANPSRSVATPDASLFGNWDKEVGGETYIHEGPIKALAEHLSSGANCISINGINGCVYQTDDGSRILHSLANPPWGPDEIVCVTFDAPDRTKPGSLKAMEKAKNKITGIVAPTCKEVRDTSCQIPNSTPDDRTLTSIDYNNLLRRADSDGEKVRKLLNSTERVISPGKSRASFVSSTEARKNRVRRASLLKGFIPSHGVGGAIGESGSGKTFCVVTLGLDIASLQTESFGCRLGLKPDTNYHVIYLGMEGSEGVLDRIDAYAKEHPERDTARLHILEDSRFDITDPNCVDALTQYARGLDGPVAMVIGDTLSKLLNGEDENSAAVCSLVEMHARTASEQLNTVFMFVHHTGKDASKGGRGSSAIKAGWDFEMTCTVEGPEDERVMTCTKHRYDKKGTTFAYELMSVPIGKDELGEDVLSCFTRTIEKTPERPDGMKTFEETITDISKVAKAIKRTYNNAVKGGKPTQSAFDKGTKSVEAKQLCVYLAMNLSKSMNMDPGEQHKVTPYFVQTFIKSHSTEFNMLEEAEKSKKSS
jgi:RecA-family ATPase